MARFSVLFALFAASVAVAAPLHQRALNLSPQCTTDRLNIFSSFFATNDALSKIDTTNPDTAAAVFAAHASLASAGDGIKDILLALITNATLSPDTRTQVSNGLAAAQTALNGVTDTTVCATLQDAQVKLAASIADGQAIVADNC
ncbi:hypothetical protein B0H19DRAFT_1085266 [Mycena capillaripes]|nr:hypothetical protein B0H19DRAFT_1085266 [Mycena capillaripes]